MSIVIEGVVVKRRTEHEFDENKEIKRSAVIKRITEGQRRRKQRLSAFLKDSNMTRQEASNRLNDAAKVNAKRYGYATSSYSPELITTIIQPEARAVGTVDFWQTMAEMTNGEGWYWLGLEDKTNEQYTEDEKAVIYWYRQLKNPLFKDIFRAIVPALADMDFKNPGQMVADAYMAMDPGQQSMVRAMVQAALENKKPGTLLTFPGSDKDLS